MVLFINYLKYFKNLLIKYNKSRIKKFLNFRNKRANLVKKFRHGKNPAQLPTNCTANGQYFNEMQGLSKGSLIAHNK